MRFPFIKQKDVTDYKAIEAEAENVRLKDDLIESLKSEIRNLNLLVITLKEMLAGRRFEVNAIGDRAQVTYDPEEKKALKKFNSRPVIRTMSEASIELERRSLNAIGTPKNAEDINPDDRQSFYSQLFW